MHTKLQSHFLQKIFAHQTFGARCYLMPMKEKTAAPSRHTGEAIGAVCVCVCIVSFEQSKYCRTKASVRDQNLQAVFANVARSMDGRSLSSACATSISARSELRRCRVLVAANTRRNKEHDGGRPWSEADTQRHLRPFPLNVPPLTHTHTQIDYSLTLHLWM